MPLFVNKSSIISGKQLQQDYRFILNIKGVDAALIKNVDVPKYTVETESYSLLEYKFNYPKKLDWDSKISFDLVQVLDEDLITSTLGFFMSKVYKSTFYSSPMGIGTGERDILFSNTLYNVREKISTFLNNGINPGYQRTANEGSVLEFSKQKLQAELGIVEIRTIDSEGQWYDTWRLNGAFISGLAPSNLSYDSEKISTVKISLSYDWAAYGFRGVFAEEDVVSRVAGIF